MFEAFCKPLSLDEFKKGYWPRKSFASHGVLSRLPALFSAPPLDSLASLLKVYRGATNFSRGSRSTSTVNAPANVLPFKLWEMGLTLYLAEVKSVIPNSDEFIKTLEKELELPAGSVRLGVFASPKGEGAPCHYDVEDIFFCAIARV